MQVDLDTGVSMEAEGLPPIPPNLCANGLLALRRGGELFFTAGPSAGLSIHWRRAADAPWARIHASTVQPAAFGPWGDRAVMMSGRNLTLFDDEPRRPEIPPRLCGPYVVGASASVILDRGDELLVASGRAASGFDAMSRVTVVFE